MATLKTVSEFITSIVGDGGPSSSTNYDIEFGAGSGTSLGRFMETHAGIKMSAGTGNQSIVKIQMLANEVQIPGISMTSQDVRSVKKGINIKPAMAKVYNEMDLSFILDVDSMPFRFFRGWQDFILGRYDLANFGGQSPFGATNTNKIHQAFAQQWYDEYTCDLTVKKYEKHVGSYASGGVLSANAGNRMYEPFHVKLVNAYPYMLSSIPYSSAASQAVKLSVGMYYEYAQFIDKRTAI